MAEKFGIPVLTYRYPGAYPGLEAEERGQGEAIARNIFEMVRLKCLLLPLLLVKELGCIRNRSGRSRLCLENTWYSVILQNLVLLFYGKLGI
jgi:acetyl-CoA carboxylase carboxyl transferase subunit alpha